MFSKMDESRFSKIRVKQRHVMCFKFAIVLCAYNVIKSLYDLGNRVDPEQLASDESS